MILWLDFLKTLLQSILLKPQIILHKTQTKINKIQTKLHRTQIKVQAIIIHKSKIKRTTANNRMEINFKIKPITVLKINQSLRNQIFAKGIAQLTFPSSNP